MIYIFDNCSWLARIPPKLWVLLITRQDSLLEVMKRGRGWPDRQVVSPGWLQCDSNAGAGEWEETLLDTAQHVWILKPEGRSFSFWKHISWLKVTGCILSDFLHGSLTVCRESCSSPSCPPLKKQSCLICEELSQNYKPDLVFQAVLNLQFSRIAK